jgi:hypothetical protein
VSLEIIPGKGQGSWSYLSTKFPSVIAWGLLTGGRRYKFLDTYALSCTEQFQWPEWGCRCRYWQGVALKWVNGYGHDSKQCPVQREIQDTNVEITSLKQLLSSFHVPCISYFNASLKSRYYYASMENKSAVSREPKHA